MVRSPRARSFSTASMRSAASTNAASSSAADEEAAASETFASVESFNRFFSASAAAFLSDLCAVTLPTATAAACLTHGAGSLDNAINDSTCGSIRCGGIFE